MRNRPLRRTVAFLLGVFLSLGMGLSSLQASGMVASMALPADMGAPAQGGCDGCGEDDDGGAKLGACPSLCVTSAVAILPATAAEAIDDAAVSVLPENFVAHGSTSLPDPSPPRPGDLG